MKAFWMISLAVTTMAALSVGCASTQSARNEQATGSHPAHECAQCKAMNGGMCPMQVPNTTVTSVDLDGGVALSFSTSADHVADLRQRVQHMAQMHSQKSADSEMDKGGMKMPAATATAQEIEGGAQLVFRPTDQTQLNALREQVRMRAAKMGHHECSKSAASPGSDSVKPEATMPQR